MSFHLVAQSKVLPGEVAILRDLPEFRKATPSMMMAAHAGAQVLKEIGTFEKNEVSVVLASNLGELETTLEFLKTYYASQLARPALFQNSLHNAILGFLTIHLGLQGPSTTVSLDEKTFLSALYTTQLFLEHTPFVLLVASDFGHPDLNPWLQQTSMKAWKDLEHADAFLFAHENTVKDRQLKSKARYRDAQEAEALANWMR